MMETLDFNFSAGFVVMLLQADLSEKH